MIGREWRGLFALIPGLAMTFMDQTILPVALPTIQKEFLSSSLSLQWAVNSYLLSTAVLVLAAGKFSDRIGFRNAYVLGMLLYGPSWDPVPLPLRSWSRFQRVSSHRRSHFLPCPASRTPCSPPECADLRFLDRPLRPGALPPSHLCRCLRPPSSEIGSPTFFFPS